MIIDALRGGLIVSCQPVAGGPMDRTDIISAFGLAAIQGGAVALRVEGHKNVHAMRKSTQTPLIGLVKRDLQSSPVRITPLMTDVEALIEAGADIIAFDATDRPRPEPIRDLLNTVHRGGKLAMADCSSLEDGQRALDLGADLIGTTLSGYVGDKEPESPDLTLVSALAAFSPNIIAEGRYRTPEQAARAMRHGALAVVVGSAITSPAGFATRLPPRAVCRMFPYDRQPAKRNGACSRSWRNQDDCCARIRPRGFGKD